MSRAQTRWELVSFLSVFLKDKVSHSTGRPQTQYAAEFLVLLPPPPEFWGHGCFTMPDFPWYRGWNLSFLRARQALYQLGYIPNLGI